MLTIRFNRIGKKNKAYFRLVVQEHTIAPGGGHVEILGSYDPHLKKDSLKPERIKYWVAKGVKFSDTAFNFLVSKGLIDGPKRKVKLPKKAEVPVAVEKPAEPKAEEKKEVV
jgi:small subunit ribosomal protein S16